MCLHTESITLLKNQLEPFRSITKHDILVHEEYRVRVLYMFGF